MPFTRFQANVSTTECFLFCRKVRRAYHRSWDNRCKLFFCYSLGQNRKIKVSVYKMFYSDCQHLFSTTVSEFFCGNSSASLRVLPRPRRRSHGCSCETNINIFPPHKSLHSSLSSSRRSLPHCPTTFDYINATILMIRSTSSSSNKSLKNHQDHCYNASQTTLD